MSPRRDWDLLGVGDTAVDLYIKVHHLPGRDEKVRGEYLGEYPGGMISNMCCAASKLGARTAMAAVVGDDRYGRIAVAGLETYGVDTSQVRVRAGGRTFFCVVLLDDSGEKALAGVKSELIVPGRADVDPEALGRARAVHLIGNDMDLARWSAREARARGTLVSLDIEAVAAAHGPDALFEVLPEVDIAFMNETGLRIGLGKDALEGAKAILEAGPSVAVVTMGSRGCVIGGPEGVVQIPAFAVPVVDTTGAGDCFCGAFISRYLQEPDPYACGRFASAAAALSVTRVGARTAAPDEAEVEMFLSAGMPALPPRARR